MYTQLMRSKVYAHYKTYLDSHCSLLDVDQIEKMVGFLPLERPLPAPENEGPLIEALTPMFGKLTPKEARLAGLRK